MVNIVIPIEQILDFTGNNAIPSIEALVDETFITGDAISIGNQKRRYHRKERAELIAEIYRIYNENRQKDVNN